MKNFCHKNNRIARILFIVIIIIILSFFFFYKSLNHNNENNNLFNSEVFNGEDLVSFSILPGQEVSGIVVITGSISGSYFFEGNVLINVLDKNKKVLKEGNGNAKTDWMTEDPVGFDSIIDFTRLPKGFAYIEIHNDNASGLPENDKSILVPIIIK